MAYNLKIANYKISLGVYRRKETSCNTVKLSINYRCGTKIVALSKSRWSRLHLRVKCIPGSPPLPFAALVWSLLVLLCLCWLLLILPPLSWPPPLFWCNSHEMQLRRWRRGRWRWRGRGIVSADAHLNASCRPWRSFSPRFPVIPRDSRSWPP